MAFGPTGGGTCLRRCARLSIPANARACPHIKPSRRPFRLSALCSNRVEQLQVCGISQGPSLLMSHLGRGFVAIPSNQPGLILLTLELVQRQAECFHGIKSLEP